MTKDVDWLVVDTILTKKMGSFTRAGAVRAVEGVEVLSDYYPYGHTPLTWARGVCLRWRARTRHRPYIDPGIGRGYAGHIRVGYKQRKFAINHIGLYVTSEDTLYQSWRSSRTGCPERSCPNSSLLAPASLDLAYKGTLSPTLCSITTCHRY